MGKFKELGVRQALMGRRDSVVRTLPPIWEQLPVLFEDPVEAEPGRGLARMISLLRKRVLCRGK